MVNIYLIRHGETDYNVKGIIQGSLDTPINENGVKQALDAMDEICKLDIYKILSSPQKRARMTSDIISSNLDMDYEIWNEFKERSFGIYQGKSYKYLRENLTEDYYKSKRDFYHRTENGESMEDVYERVKSAFEKIKNEWDGKNILIVSHGSTVRIIDAYFRFEKGQVDFDIHMENCKIYHYVIK